MATVAVPRVEEIMVANPLAVSPDTAAVEAAKIMCHQNIGAVVVCDGDNIVGILTERDVLRRAACAESWREVPVKELMTPRPITVRVGESLWKVGQILRDHLVRHLPVTEDGRLVGMLSVRDLLRHSTQLLEAMVQERTHALRAKTEALEARDKLIQRHLQVAGKTQRQMLPPLECEYPPLSIAVLYHPYDQVSGDYYDLVPMNGEQLAILIADASGHGLAAALVSVVTKAVFFTEGRRSETPSAVLNLMNERVLDLIEGEHFVTMFYCLIDRKSLVARFASAGHPAPLWFRAGCRAIERLHASGIMLGVETVPRFEENTVQLGPGDALLLFTDGLVECADGKRNRFGEDRLCELFVGLASKSAREIRRDLATEFQEFRGEAPVGDDVSFIVIKVDPELEK